MQEAIAEREERIAYHAYHDALSGLPNRQRLLQILQPLFESRLPLTVVNFSIDRFGQIASSLGHNASHKVLKLVAETLQRNLRDAQHLAHLGGNEFVMAFKGADVAGARRWVEHLGHLLHAGVSLAGANISLQARAGIALYPEHSDNGADLLRRAAVARSHAAANHESLAIFEPAEEEQHRRQIKIIGDFPAAVTDQQLRLYLQPKINCATHAVIGAEALVRWEHPTFGLLMPDQFVDVIERAGSIAHLSRWIINEAVSCCQDWRDSGLELTVAINLSVHDLVDQNLPYNLLDVVKSHGLKASNVILEITESAIMHNVSRSVRVLECIQDIGFGIALDDFGTGQSSLTQLRRLPLDEVKIDKSFVMNMTDPKDDVIVRATIELAHNLGFRVVGEGVETEALLARLVELGCEYAQGYYISKPVPADAFIAWAQRWQQAHDTNIVRLRRSQTDRA
jgi:diguanylate cyclase (GGDEF)-like protein